MVLQLFEQGLEILAPVFYSLIFLLLGACVAPVVQPTQIEFKSPIQFIDITPQDKKAPRIGTNQFTLEGFYSEKGSTIYIWKDVVTGRRYIVSHFGGIFLLTE